MEITVFWNVTLYTLVEHYQTYLPGILKMEAAASSETLLRQQAAVARSA
jgi:hypothetical protein